MEGKQRGPTDPKMAYDYQQIGPEGHLNTTAYPVDNVNHLYLDHPPKYDASTTPQTQPGYPHYQAQLGYPNQQQLAWYPSQQPQSGFSNPQPQQGHFNQPQQHGYPYQQPQSG